MSARRSGKLRTQAAGPGRCRQLGRLHAGKEEDEGGLWAGAASTASRGGERFGICGMWAVGTWAHAIRFPDDNLSQPP
jgi:hypothetical protein